MSMTRSVSLSSPGEAPAPRTSGGVSVSCFMRRARATASDPDGAPRYQNAAYPASKGGVDSRPA